MKIRSGMVWALKLPCSASWEIARIANHKRLLLNFRKLKVESRKRGAVLLGKTRGLKREKAKPSLLDGTFDGICFIDLIKKQAI